MISSGGLETKVDFSCYIIDDLNRSIYEVIYMIDIDIYTYIYTYTYIYIFTNYMTLIICYASVR